MRILHRSLSEVAAVNDSVKFSVFRGIKFVTQYGAAKELPMPWKELPMSRYSLNIYDCYTTAAPNPPSSLPDTRR